MPRRFVLVGLGAMAALLVIAAAAAVWLVDIGAHKARFEVAASRALGMEGGIGGRMGIDLFPGLLVTLGDVQVRNRGLEVASVERARLAIEWLPLLHRQIRVRTIELKALRLSVARGNDGLFNVERPDATDATLPALDWRSVTLVDAKLDYADKQAGDAVHATACNLVAHRVRSAGGRTTDLLRDLSFAAELSCAQVRTGSFAVTDLVLSADAKNGVLELKPVTARTFDTQGTGSVRVDFSGSVPGYQIHYSVMQFPIEAYFGARSEKVLASGRMDFSASLSMQGRSGKALRGSAKGQVSLRGENLTLIGSDLDQQFSRYESSQTFNVVDVGALFFAGPLGLVITKGYDFATLLQGQGGHSEIRTLVSLWKVDNGVAHALDVAMATRANRVALRGGLDFVNEEFRDVTVALIDAKGCARLQQRVRGSFQQPVVDRPSLLESLTGPALRLLKKGRELLGDKPCEVFYAGSVAAPK